MLGISDVIHLECLLLRISLGELGLMASSRRAYHDQVSRCLFQSEYRKSLSLINRIEAIPCGFLASHRHHAASAPLSPSLDILFGANEYS
jgi:hypothetical protein